MAFAGGSSSFKGVRAAGRALQGAQSCGSSKRCLSSKAPSGTASSASSSGSSTPASSRPNADMSIRIEMPFALPSLAMEFRIPRTLNFLSGSTESDACLENEGSDLESHLALAGPSSSAHTLASLREQGGAQQEDVFRWDGLLNAVPKSKVSHSRKSMRSANKGLKNRFDLVHCPSCGAPKLAHHVCASCYFEIARREKATGTRWASSSASSRPPTSAPRTSASGSRTAADASGGAAASIGRLTQGGAVSSTGPGKA